MNSLGGHNRYDVSISFATSSRSGFESLPSPSDPGPTNKGTRVHQAEELAVLAHAAARSDQGGVAVADHLARRLLGMSPYRPSSRGVEHRPAVRDLVEWPGEAPSDSPHVLSRGSRIEQAAARSSALCPKPRR